MLSRALRPGVAVALLTLASTVQATMLMQFNLKELATRADPRLPGPCGRRGNRHRAHRGR